MSRKLLADKCKYPLSQAAHYGVLLWELNTGLPKMCSLVLFDQI